MPALRKRLRVLRWERQVPRGCHPQANARAAPADEKRVSPIATEGRCCPRPRAQACSGGGLRRGKRPRVDAPADAMPAPPMLGMLHNAGSSNRRLGPKALVGQQAHAGMPYNGLGALGGGVYAAPQMAGSGAVVRALNGGVYEVPQMVNLGAAAIQRVPSLGALEATVAEGTCSTPWLDSIPQHLADCLGAQSISSAPGIGGVFTENNWQALGMDLDSELRTMVSAQDLDLYMLGGAGAPTMAQVESAPLHSPHGERAV